MKMFNTTSLSQKSMNGSLLESIELFSETNRLCQTWEVELNSIVLTWRERTNKSQLLFKTWDK